MIRAISSSGLLLALVLALQLLAPRAGALTISTSNTFYLTWNGVVTHQPGDEYSYFLVNDYGGPTNSTDVGFATLSSSASVFDLTANSYVDGTQIEPLGYDYAIAEASGRIDTDIVFGGGTGSFRLVITTDVHTEAWSTGDETFIGQDFAALEAISTPLGIDYDPVTGTVTYTLEYGVPYHYESRISAYSRAEVGVQTERRRTLSVAFTLVPEPSSAALVAVGLLGMTAHLRSRRARTAPASRSARP